MRFDRASARKKLKRRYRGRPDARHRAKMRMKRRLARDVRPAVVRSAVVSDQVLRLKKPSFAGYGTMRVHLTSGLAITTGPRAATSSSAAEFRFATLLPATTFQCRLDGAAWEQCVSPFRAEGLSEGDILSLRPEAASGAAQYDTVAGSQSDALVALRGSGDALPLLPDARHALQLPETVLTPDLAPLYGRPPDAKVKGAA